MATTTEAPVREQVENGQMNEEEMKLRQIAFQREMMMRSANILMQALSVGGSEVKPLFDKEQRAILEEKLYGILKVL